MECSCGGVLIEGKSSHKVSETNFMLIIENIPAYQCQRCGKILFKDETVEKIQKLANRVKRDTKEIITGQVSTNLYEY